MLELLLDVILLKDVDDSEEVRLAPWSPVLSSRAQSTEVYLPLGDDARILAPDAPRDDSSSVNAPWNLLGSSTRSLSTKIDLIEDLILVSDLL